MGTDDIRECCGRRAVGTVDAATVSGDVIVSTSEMIHASSVSGSLELEIHGSRWDDLSFSTVSGDVTVYLPDNIDTDVRCSTPCQAIFKPISI